ncbi:MAG: flagellar biosynthesis anti-sigma factor FlgM [Treponema sp.]|nr:flagellar biosynthesis anti-sigma factor FlgM [Treponema sp.]
MTVDRIGHVEPISPGKKPGRSEQVGGNIRTDSISLSSEALKKAEMYQVVELIKAAPELDDAKIAELRQKIDDPAYLNEMVINATAEKLMNTWFT